MDWSFINFVDLASRFLPMMLSVLFAGVVLASLILFRRKISQLLIALIKKCLHRVSLAEPIADAFFKPISGLCVLLGIYFALSRLSDTFLREAQDASAQNLLLHSLKIGIIVLLTWGMINSTEPIVTAVRKNGGNEDKTILLFAGKIVKVILLILAVVVIIDELGYNITGIITGLGLGGLTFALAAQDTASNFFGGLVIIGDKPFAVDDWIQTPALEGVVTNITLRTTRIRTFKDAEIVVPNSALANAAITNWSRMSKRKVSFTLTLTYDTSKEQLQAARDGVLALLNAHPDVLEDSPLVTFQAFSPYSLDLEVAYFVSRTAYPEYMKIKEEINYQILDCFEQLGVSFAYPTQTVLLGKSE